ncbi:MarR family winged helix-turn-helix transcriptional regulator [Diaminobutyricibacter sp. McL0618]|uniref:MarR family winged helix-turn-helix transcriptional regulator n=1 Tax=Leifsonia sp. McL0618 TaxID=3415677 RepID=UPI003CE8DFD3
MDAALSKREFDAYAALVASSTLLQRAITDNLHEQRSDLTQVQFEILAALSNAPEGYRMAELADQLIVSRSGLTYQAGLLEKAGLITRARDGSDERGVVARVTEKGRSVWEGVLPGHVALVRAAFLGLLTPDELDTLTGLLGRVTAALENSGQ